MTTVATSAASASTAAATAAASASSSSPSGAASVSTTLNTFLSLLTTQLKNQDPLNATDPNQFTQEIVQINTLEQQVAGNSTLSTISSTLTGMSSASSMSSGVGYIGKTVETDTATAPLSNGQAEWSYKLPSGATSTQLTITDSGGNVVWQGTGSSSAGVNPVTWNGTEASGATAPAGAYTLSVASTDAQNNAVTATVSSVGVVTAVNSSSGTTQLVLGGEVDVPVSAVTSIATSSTSLSSSS